MLFTMKLLTDQVRNQYELGTESDHISEISVRSNTGGLRQLGGQCGALRWSEVVSGGGGGGGGGGEVAPVLTALFSAHIFSRQSLLAPHNRRSQKQRREDF